ncbi:MerR family transcriptional regulator [bacterium]|nr:MerR family transcriptional regulator [bacterium]
MSKEPLYPIGVVAEMLDLHAQTLRAYEGKGLVVPARRGGQRLYSDDDVSALRQVLTLTRDLGVNLAGVEVILRMRREQGRMRGEMQSFVAKLQSLLALERERAGREGAIVRMVDEGLVRWTKDPEEP